MLEYSAFPLPLSRTRSNHLEGKDMQIEEISENLPKAWKFQPPVGVKQ